MKLLTVACVALLGLAGIANAEPQRLTPKERDTALQQIEKLIQERYVFPELRPAIVDALEQKRRAGRYDTDDPLAFADRVTEDLRTAGKDRHLWMRVDPPGYAAALRTPEDDKGDDAYWRELATRNHHGLADMRILPGNIRYLRITQFYWVQDVTGAVYDDAMRFLKDGDAVVIDLRNNPGGSHGAVQYLISYFMDPDVLEYTFFESGKPPRQSRTAEYLSAGRLKGKPLYVLVNRGTGSAAEAFAYDVKQFKAGELIGENTAGAANNNALLPVAPYFILSVSFGRPEHAVSKTNWEHDGVTPDVASAPALALETAQKLALERLSANPKATEAQRLEYRWAKFGVDAALHPVRPDPAALAAFAGSYRKSGGKGDPITLAQRDGTLWIALPHWPEARLLPMTQDTFGVEGVDRLRVRLTGKALELWWSDEAAPRVYPREG
jgi:hypothetical protein